MIEPDPCNIPIHRQCNVCGRALIHPTELVCGVCIPCVNNETEEEYQKEKNP